MFLHVRMSVVRKILPAAPPSVFDAWVEVASIEQPRLPIPYGCLCGVFVSVGRSIDTAAAVEVGLD